MTRDNLLSFRRLPLRRAALVFVTPVVLTVLLEAVAFDLCSLSSKDAQRALALPRLTDVAQSSGICFNHVAMPQKYIPEEIGGGVLLVDFERAGPGPAAADWFNNALPSGRFDLLNTTGIADAFCVTLGDLLRVLCSSFNFLL